MSELSTSEARKLMEVYKAMCASQQENLSEEVEQIDEDLIGDLIANRGNIKRGATSAIQTTNRAAAATNRSLGQAATQTGNQIKSGTKQTAKDVVQGYKVGGATGAAGALGTNIVKGIMGSRPGATPAKPTAKTAPTAPAKPAASQYTAKNLGSAQYAAFKSGGGDAAIRQGYSAGEVVARGRAATKPAAPAPAARPAAPAPAAKVAPAATAPRPGTKAAGPESIKPKTPNPLMQKTFGYQTGNAPDQIAKASAGAPPTPSGSALGAAAKPEVRKALNLPLKATTPTQATAAAPSTSAATSGSVAPATAKLAAAPKPVPMSPREKALNQSYEYDTYDLVLEYLLDNGHVDTVEEAHYVMLEMDSEYIQSICEAKYGTKAGRKALAKKVRAGKNIGKKGPGTGFKAVEKAAEKGGAEDPEAVAAAAMWKTYGGKKGKTQKEW